MGNLRFVICVLLFSLMAATPLAAQSASLVGTVKDAQEAVVPNALVTLTNLDTGVSQTTQSDAAGNYEFPQIRPGNYSVKIEHAGFKTYSQSPIVLAVTQRVRADASMQVGDTATLINVEAQSSG